MKIKTWGCRGSIPSPGPSTIRYGGNGTCVEVSPNDKHVIIIDAGSGIRNLGKEILHRKNITKICLVLTHSHWDHVMGFPFFLPGYFARFTINVCGGQIAQDSLQKFLAHQMEAPYFPIDFNLLKAKFCFGCTCPDTAPENIKIESIPLSHPNSCYGYRLRHEGKTFVFMTDNELGYQHPGSTDRDGFIDFCRGADLLFHDSQFTDDEYRRTQTWGHSTFNQAIDLARDAGVKRLGFVHHDPDRTDDDMDHHVEIARSRIEREKLNLECFGVKEESVVEL